MGVWVQNGRNYIGCLPGDCMSDWELLLAALPASQESITLHIVSPGKDLNLKFELRLLQNAYHFRTLVK